MKKVFFMIVALALGIATAKGQETFNITQLGDTLELCDYITQLTIEKDPAYNSTPFWINGNNEVFQEDHLVIELDNNGDGKVVYLEKGNCYMKCVNIKIKPNEMPLPSQDTAWLQEDLWYNPEPLTLKATEEDLGYLYTWRSTNWPIDSSYVNYELTVGNAGNYLGGMVDECLHYSEKSFYVEKATVIGYVSTNLNLNLNELHWTPKGSTYDTIAIFRNGYIVTIEDKHIGIWVDPVFNNEYGTPWYQMFAIKNGRIIEESASRWKTGLSLEKQNETTETIEFSFHGLDNEMAYPLEGYVQYYKLYSVDETNELNLEQNEIPVGTTHLTGIANEHNAWMIAARLWNGVEIYSNIVNSNGTMKTNENTIDKIQVYPNPVTDGMLLVSCKNADYIITNIQGQTVQSGTCSRRIDVSNLPSGIYIIKIKDSTTTTTTRFVVG